MSRSVHTLATLATLALLLVGFSAGAQDVFYVDAVNGDDGNSGRSLAQAKATIKSVGELVGPGDQVLIQPGVYREDGGNDVNNTIFIARSGSQDG